MSPCPLSPSIFFLSAVISVLAFVAGAVLAVNAFHSFYLLNIVCNEIALPDYSRRILAPVTKDKHIYAAGLQVLRGTAFAMLVGWS